jgi:hypothetical protein
MGIIKTDISESSGKIDVCELYFEADEKQYFYKQDKKYRINLKIVIIASSHVSSWYARVESLYLSHMTMDPPSSYVGFIC